MRGTITDATSSTTRLNSFCLLRSEIQQKVLTFNGHSFGSILTGAFDIVHNFTFL